jgi:hypothetical protein
VRTKKRELASDRPTQCQDATVTPLSLTAHQDSGRRSVPAKDLQRLHDPQGTVKGLRDEQVKADDTVGRAEARAVAAIAEVEPFELHADVVTRDG